VGTVCCRFKVVVALLAATDVVYYKLRLFRTLDAGGKPSTWFPPGDNSPSFLPNSEANCSGRAKVAVAHKSAHKVHPHKSARIRRRAQQDNETGREREEDKGE